MCGLVGSDLTAEEGVVVVEPRLALCVVGGAAVEDHALEHVGPRPVRSQLRAAPVAVAHEHARELRRECGVVVDEGVVERRDEQHEGRDALLTVDQHEVRIVGCAGGRSGEDRADEVRVPVVGVGDGADVVEQLLAPADVPAVLALIDGDHDRGLGCREPRDRVDGGGIDIRGSAHVLRIAPRNPRRV